MRSFREISEARGDTAIFCIGRFNPPTTGHLKMIEAAAAQQLKYAGAPFYVFPTHSQDPAKNPLPHSLKVAYMKKMFKKYAKNIQVSKARNVFEMATMLHDKGHRSIILVAGSDRVDEFDKLLNQYNGVDGRHGYYGFDNIEVISAGERDPDAEGVEGMSASKMRAAAATGDFDDFVLGLPSGFRDGKKLFRDVRKHMGIREERDMGEMTDYEELRDAYLTNKIWKIDDLVEANGVEGRIVRRGTNYISYMDGSGKVHKAWLHDIALNERNYRKEYDNYHSRPEQIEKRSSRNKARRSMGDNAVKGMDVGHKDNNPLNNDPKNLRNEDPSKNRREPRLREEEELDEKIGEMAWYRKVMAKIDQMTHPRGFEKMVKQFADRMTEPKNKDRNPSAVAADVAREYDVSARAFIQYTNKLVQKGVLPKELKAEYQTESFTFKNFVQQINEVKQDKDIKDKEGTHKVKQMYGEALPKDADMGDYIDDFKKSDAPQFKGKSKEKRKDMAIAAYLDKQDVEELLRLEAYQLDEKIEALVKKAEKSGMPYSILKKVYDRGMAAYKTGHRPGTTPQQWALARVNSFTTKSSGTWGKADADLAKQVRGENLGEAELNEWGEVEEAAEYKGRKVTLNKPTKGDIKKSKVYVKNEKGNVVKVEFGDPNMQIQKDIPAKRKSFRARHNCDNPGPKWKARYWSCKAW